jgi:MarR family transcriptional regulator, organic hydroperoxide resistance regulator
MGASTSARENRKRGASNAPKFSPLTISLDPFVKDGTDQRFRKLIYSLLRLMNLMSRNAKHFAEYMGVSAAQGMMMSRIADSPGITVTQLADQLGVSGPFVTAEIGKLVEKSIVEKRPNEADRRSMLLMLTTKGQSLMRELGPVRRRTNDIMFKSMTDERASALQEIVTTLIADAQIGLHELEAPHMLGQRAPSVLPDLSSEANSNHDGRKRSKRPTWRTGQRR